jgi:tRNA (guanine37-N1)-methyltransferase
MFEPILNASILGRACQKGLLQIKVYNIRDFAQNIHKQADDYPFGGGAGMVMLPQPIIDATRHVIGEQGDGRRIYMSPRGKVFHAQEAVTLSKEEHLIILCGHYEGVDERALQSEKYEEYSIGDYVLTGGELPAMVLIDAVSRHVKGVLGDEASAEEESFSLKGTIFVIRGEEVGCSFTLFIFCPYTYTDIESTIKVMVLLKPFFR